MAAAFAAAIALSTLAGWHFDIWWLRGSWRGNPGMVPLVAFSVLAIATGLTTSQAASRRAHVMGALVASLAVVCAGLSLLAYVVPLDLSALELVVYRDKLPAVLSGVPAGRMPIASALGIVLAGVTAAMSNARRLLRADAVPGTGVSYVAAIVAELALAGMLAHVYAWNGMFADLPARLFSAPTAVSFAGLAIAMFGLVPESPLVRVWRDRGPAGRAVRRLLPAVLAAMVVLNAALTIAGDNESITFPEGAFVGSFVQLLLLMAVVMFTGRDLYRLEARRLESVRRRDDAERAAQQAHDELALVFDSVPVALAFLDTELRYSRVNARMCELHGAPESQILGYRPSELLPRAGVEIEADIQRVLDTGHPSSRESSTDTRARSGAIRDYLASWHPVRDRSGTVSGIAAVVVDVTEERKAARERARLLEAEREAHRSADLLQQVTAALAAADDAVAVAAALSSHVLPELAAQQCGVAVLDQQMAALRIVSDVGTGSPWPAQVPLEAELPLTDAVQWGEPVILADLDAWTAIYGDAVVAGHRTAGLQAALAMPFVVDGGVLGGMQLGFDRERRFSSDEMALLQAMCTQAALALQRIRLREQEREAVAQRLDAERRDRQVLDLMEEIRGLDDPEAIVQIMLQRVRLHTGADYVMFFECLIERDVFHFMGESRADGLPSLRGSSPYTTPAAVFAPEDLASFRAGRALAQERAVPVLQDPQYSNERMREAARLGLQSLLRIPLLERGELVAGITLLYGARRQWSEHDVNLLTDLARRAWDVISKVRALQGLRQLTAELEQRIDERTAELTEANRQLTEGSARKSRFVAHMSHEVRTPLNAILGFCQLMESGVLGETTPQQQECLGDVLASGNHLVRIIDDVLDVARVEAGRITFRPEPVEVGPLLEECLAMLAITAHEAGVAMSIEHDPAECPVVITDMGRLRQVLLNLLSNALKWTRRGGTVRLVVHRALGDTLRFEVVDTGVGIPAEKQARLFQEFERVDARDILPGTGLGLALVRQLVEAQGGRVGVASEHGTGSTFWVELPAPPEVEVATVAVPNQRHVRQ